MGRLVDAVCPPRLGTGFRWLLSSSWISNLGDGIALASGPLLVASQTSDPVLVAAAGFLQRLPWVLFGLQAGVLADRHDRRRIVVLVNLARAAVLAVLAVSIMTDTVNVAVVLSAMFLLGTAETFADITTGTLLPMIVDHDDLGVANARLGVGHITVNQLAGPPLGAVLFAAGMASPFVAQAVFVALGAVLVGKVSLGVAPPATRGPTLDARRDRRRGAMAVAPPTGAHAHPDRARVQRHVRVDARDPRAVLARAARTRRARLRAAHHGRRAWAGSSVRRRTVGSSAGSARRP